MNEMKFQKKKIIFIIIIIIIIIIISSDHYQHVTSVWLHSQHKMK